MNQKYSIVKTALALINALCIALILTIPFTIRFNQNASFLQVNKEELFQFRFAAIIDQTSNATLLNYGSGDVGLYTTTGITPNVKYFQNYNFEYSKYQKDVDEQNRYIQERLVDFIVLRVMPGDSEYLKNPDLASNYHLIASQNQGFEGIEFSYLLFEKNN